MWDFSIARSLGLMARTAPYITFRIIVYFGIACIYIAATGAGAGIGFGVGQFGDEDFLASSTVLGGAVGFGIVAAILYFLREYILYILKAGHIAVLVELLDSGTLPNGQGQIAYGKTVVQERFVQASVLFGLDQLIKGVINAITGLLEGIASILPIPGLEQLISFFRAFLKVAVGFVDEVILAHAIRTRADNPWSAAEEALVLYGQNYKAMLKNAAVIAVISYGLAFIVFLLMLAPAAGLAYLMPGGWSAGGIAFAILFAWAVKAALIEPFAICCMMQAFFHVTEGQSPNPEWRAKLASLSAKFRDIGNKAAHWVPARTVNATSQPEPTA
ncbi:hypothetical protein [Rhizobium sp. L1K21]|uniref:hypothetical protein n=1 Tax=Rhizobium sp. L1K21 TaxID=2954933 RepID=UPI0020927B4C|nr:hypothetical protein [Rhizobium sp. L1K21]MCO6187044.1 hypothetical protein [Rhizobium sp. L1K21]